MASLEERREARRRRRAAGGDDDLNIGGVTPDRSEVIDAVNERLARRRREREGRRIVELSTENAENGEGESDLERRRRERREARLRESAETPADEETTSRRSRRRESNEPSEEESASSRRRRAKEQEEEAEAESAPAEEEEQPAEEEDNTAAQEAAERRRRQEEEEEERKREEAAERKRQEQERIRQKQEEEEERRRQEEECAFFDMIYGCGDDKTSELSELDTKMIESYEYVTKNMKEKTMSRLVQNGSDVNSNMSDNSLCYQADSESHCQDTDTTDAGESEIFEYPKESRTLSHVRETYGSTCTSDCESYEENRREKRYTRKVKSPGVDPRATPINYYSDSDMTDTMEEDEDNDLAQTYTNAKFSEQVQYSGDEEINNERQRNGDGFESATKENPTQNMTSCVEKQQRKTSFDIKQNHKSNVGQLKNQDNGNIPLKEEQTTSFAVPRLDFGGGGSSKTSSSDSEGKNHHPIALGDGIGSRLKSVSNLLELDFGDEYEANQSQCLTDSSPSDAEPPSRKTSSSSIGSKLNSKMAAMYASFTADDRVELSPRRQTDNKPTVKPRKKSLATSSDSPCSSPRNGSGNLTPRKNGGYIPAVITDESIEAAKSCKYSPRKQMDKWKLPIPIPGMIKNTTQFVNSSKVTKVSDNLIKEEVKVLPKPRPLSADRGRTFIEMKEREEERKRLGELEKKNKMNKSVLDLIAQRQHFHSRRNDIGIPSPRDVPDSSKVSVRETLMSSGCELSSPRTSSPRISSLRTTKPESIVSPRGTPLKVHHASRFDDILKDVVSPRRSSLKDESGRNVGEIKGWREFQQEYNTKRRVSKIDFSSDSDCDRSEKSNLRKSDMEFLSPRNRDLRLNLSSVTGENSLLRKINSFQDRIHSIETANNKDSNSVISPRVRSSSHDGRVSHIKAKLLKSETGSPSNSLTFSPRGVGVSSISNVKGNNSNNDITSGSMDQSNLRPNKLMRDNSASRKNRVFMSHDVSTTNHLDGVDSASNKRVDLKNIGRKLSQVNLDRVTLQLMSTVKNRLNKFESKINSPRSPRVDSPRESRAFRVCRESMEENEKSRNQQFDKEKNKSSRQRFTQITGVSDRPSNGIVGNNDNKPSPRRVLPATPNKYSEQSNTNGTDRYSRSATGVRKSPVPLPHNRESPSNARNSLHNDRNSPIMVINGRGSPVDSSRNTLQNGRDSPANIRNGFQNGRESPILVTNGRKSPGNSRNVLQKCRESPISFMNGRESPINSRNTLQNERVSPVNSRNSLQNGRESPVNSRNSLQNGRESPMPARNGRDSPVDFVSRIRSCQESPLPIRRSRYDRCQDEKLQRQFSTINEDRKLSIVSSSGFESSEDDDDCGQMRSFKKLLENDDNSRGSPGLQRKYGSLRDSCESLIESPSSTTRSHSRSSSNSRMNEILQKFENLTSEISRPSERRTSIGRFDGIGRRLSRGLSMEDLRMRFSCEDLSPQSEIYSSDCMSPRWSSTRNCSMLGIKSART